MKKIFLLIILIFLPQIALAESNLAVPFTSQAPYYNWREPWQNFCEEASILMVDSYYAKKNLNQLTAKTELLRINRIKENQYGRSLDENAQKITELINLFLPWEAKTVSNPTPEQIKNEIDNSRPVIIPVYGKSLKNPYFKNGGPIYHVLVISGYNEDKKEFITQEPGTRFGLDFRYKYDTILNAIHDFLPGFNTRNGQKIAIFTSPIIDQSKNYDGDNDGLIKAEEMKYGTITWLKDSDGDGHSDGDEVKSGYSPTKKFERL
ncbi:MAG: C39 family peptidase [Candidatus Magasanikiibacteriota bacterium]